MRQLFEINGYILPYGSFFPTFTHIYFQIYRCSQFLSSYECPFPNSTTRKGYNKRLVYQLFKTSRRNVSYIPRVKKSSVKWKCEKEIVHLVHNYSVTGREPRKNVLLLAINLLLLWAIFLFFFSKVSSIFLLHFHKWSNVHQNWCSHIKNITSKTW